MTLQEVYTVLNIKLRQAGRPTLTVYQFNALLKYVNRKLFTILLKELDSNQEVIDLLSPFSQEASLTLTDGKSDKPADYERKGTIRANGRPVEILSHDNFDIRVNSPIKPPTSDFPIAKHVGNEIWFNPVDLSAIKIEYYSLPTDPVYVEKSGDSGESVYDSANSTEIAWSDGSRDLFIDLLEQELFKIQKS